MKLQTFNRWAVLALFAAQLFLNDIQRRINATNIEIHASLLETVNFQRAAIKTLTDCVQELQDNGQNAD